jgi:HSP20 family molecular chaperone IbpA
MKKQNLPSLFNYRDSFIDSFDSVFDQMVHKQFPTLTDQLGIDFLSKSAYPRVDIVDFKDRLEITSEIPLSDNLASSRIKAKFENGTLNIAIPKIEPKIEEAQIVDIE